MDNFNPTIAQVERLIPNTYRVACELMGEDWCHPKQLRQIREMTSTIIKRKSPETHPEEYRANTWLDNADNDIYSRWQDLALPWAIMLEEWTGPKTGAYAHLVRAVLDNLQKNWYYFDAPMIVWKEFNDETHILQRV